MHASLCPRCGERVTPYAAGCALCGADLDPRRWQRPPSLADRLTSPLARRWRRARVHRDAAPRR